MGGIIGQGDAKKPLQGLLWRFFIGMNMGSNANIGIMAAMTVIGGIEGYFEAGKKRKQAQQAAESQDIQNYNNALQNYYQVDAADASYGIVGTSSHAPKAANYGLDTMALSDVGGVRGNDGLIVDHNNPQAIFGQIARPQQVSTVDSIFQGASSGLAAGTSLASAFSNFQSTTAKKS